MSGFSADWLALREPADARARDACSGLLDALPRCAAPATAAAHAGTVDAAAPLQVLDLGAGTGANFRYLQPRLRGAPHWTLADHDRALLDVAVARAATTARLATTVVDLAAALESLAFPAGGLVTASALLDLVSGPWLARLADRCRAARAQVLFALTYDGRCTCRPTEPDDVKIIALVNRHQRTDKGFGPALGPAAAHAAAAQFALRGYRVRRARSDWRIDASEPALQAALLGGWAQAARAIEPAAGAQVDDWLERRRRHLANGRSQLTVGHEDLAGWLTD